MLIIFFELNFSIYVYYVCVCVSDSDIETTRKIFKCFLASNIQDSSEYLVFGVLNKISLGNNPNYLLEYFYYLHLTT